MNKTPVQITLNIGKLIEKVEIIISDGLSPEEVKHYEKQCLSHVEALKEKMLQLIATPLKFEPLIQGENNEYKKEHH